MIIPYISNKMIQSKIQEIADNILNWTDDATCILYIRNGATKFANDLYTDLINKSNIYFELKSIRIKTYLDKESKLKPSIEDEYVIGQINSNNIVIVDDICDTGKTLSFAKNRILELTNNKKIITTVLLNKQDRRIVDIIPDSIGFEIIDKFVIGYGLDYNENYRDLDYVGILDEGSTI